MLKRLLSLVALGLLTHSSFAATATSAWARSAGGPMGTTSSAVDIAIGSDGAAYALLEVASGGVDQTDVQVRKYRADGSLEWTHTLPDIGNANDEACRIVLKPLTGTVFFTAIRETAARDKQLVVTALNPASGAKVWDYLRADFNSANGLLLKDNTLTVGGSVKGVLAINNAALLKLSTAGAFLNAAQWNRTLFHPTTTVDLILSGDNVYAALQSDDSGNHRATLAKYDANLTELWSRSLPDDNQSPVGVAENSANEVFLAVASGTGVSTITRVVRYAADGRTLWDTLYSWQGYQDTPVGIYSKGVNVYAPGTSRNDQGFSFVVPAWGTTSYPVTLGIFDNDGTTKTLQSVLNTGTGPILAGITRPNIMQPSQVYALKMKGLGQKAWSFNFGDLYHHVNRIAVAGDGSVFLAGQSESSGARLAHVRKLAIALSPTAFTITPQSAVGGATVVGKVTLEEAAPAGGYAVNLTSNNPNIVVPNSVVVPAGLAVGTFNITTKPVPSTITGKVTATRSGVSLDANLQVVAPKLVQIQATPISPGDLIYGGELYKFTVFLSGPAPAGGRLVSITAGSTVGLPNTVSVPAGKASATINGTAVRTSVKKILTIEAKLAAVAAKTSLTVQAPKVVDLDPTPDLVRAGDLVGMTVTMRGKAEKPYSVSISSPSQYIVPKNITVPTGTLTGSVALTTKPIPTAQTTVSVGAAYLTTSKSTTITLRQLGAVSYAILPNTGKPGATVKHIVFLNKAALVKATVRLVGGGWDHNVTFNPGDLKKEVSLKVFSLSPGKYTVNALSGGVKMAAAPFQILAP